MAEVSDACTDGGPRRAGNPRMNADASMRPKFQAAHRMEAR
jgi:hypothetical protein